MASYADYLAAVRAKQDDDRKRRQADLAQRLSSGQVQKKSSDGNGNGFLSDTVNNAGKLITGLFNDATEIPRKAIATVKAAIDPTEIQDKIDAANAKYKSGDISQDELKSQFDDLTKDLVGIKLKVTKDGVVASNKADAAKKFIQDVAGSGVDTASVLPVGGGVKALSTVGKLATGDTSRKLIGNLTSDALKNIVKDNAKQGLVYGTASTGNDIIQGNGVDAGSFASNYIAPTVIGAGIPVAGSVAAAGAKRGVQAASKVLQDFKSIGGAQSEAGFIRIPGGGRVPDDPNALTRNQPVNSTGPHPDTIEPAGFMPGADLREKPAPVETPSDRTNPNRTNPAGLPEALPSTGRAPVVDGSGKRAFENGKASTEVFGESAPVIDNAKNKYIAAINRGDAAGAADARESLLSLDVDKNANVARTDLVHRLDQYSNEKGRAAADTPPMLDADTTPAASAAPSAQAEIGDTVIHLPGSDSYARITPEQVSVLRDERNAIPSNAGDVVHLSALTPALQRGAKEVSLDDIKSMSSNAKTALDNIGDVAHTTTEQADSRFFNREQQLKDTKPKGGFFATAQQALFDKNAPLSAYGKDYKARTGGTLAAEDDPHALRQLANGAPEAALEGLQGVFNDLSYIRSNKLNDELMRYGVAKQVVNDRAGDYPESVVKEMQGTINRIEQTLPADQVKQLEAARLNIVDYHNSQLERMVKEGTLSKEWYDNIKARNGDYFTGFNFQEHVSGNEKGFARTNSGNNAKAPIQSIRGVSDDGKFTIEDPTTAIPRAAINLETQLANHRVIDAMNRYADANPESNLAVRLSTPEDIDARIDLGTQNKGLRRIRNEVIKTLQRDTKTTRKLGSAINSLEIRGMNLSLKGGGQRLAGDKVNIKGLGGDVATSKTGRLDPNATDEFTELSRDAQRGINMREKGNTKGQGLVDEAIIEGAGTQAKTIESKLGPADTARVVKNLIENGKRSDIDRLKKMVGTRDVKLQALLDHIGSLKSDFDDVATQIRSNREEALNHIDKDVPEGYEAITTWEDGKKVRTAVLQPIADALKGKNDIQVGTIESLLGKASKPFRGAATVFSPGFAPFTAFKDFGQWVLTSENIPAHERALLVPAAVRWSKGLFASVFNTDLAKMATAAGAGGSNTLAQDTEGLIKESAKNFGGQTVTSTSSLFKKAGQIVDKYSGFKGYRKVSVAINRHLEYAPKLAEFQAALDKGKSVTGAAIDARRTVADMQNSGVVGRLLNNFVPFTNATLQGTGKLAGYAKANPGTFTALAGATIALPTVTAYAWNNSMYPDVYDNLSQYEKDNNFIIILGDNQDDSGRYTDVVKIPKTDAAKVLAGPIDAGLQAINGKDHDSITALLLKSIGYVQPISVEDNGELSGRAVVDSTVAANPLIKVPVELATNTNLFNGSQITPDNQKGLDAQDQVKASTPGIDKAISKLTGGAINPEQSTIVRQGLTASVGNTDPGTTLTKRFVGANGGANEDEFYKLYNEVKNDRAKASNAVNKAIAAGDLSAAQDIVSRYNANFKSTFDPWVTKFGANASADMKDSFVSLQFNLTNSSVKQRQKTIAKKAADATRQ